MEVPAPVTTSRTSYLQHLTCVCPVQGGRSSPSPGALGPAAGRISVYEQRAKLLFELGRAQVCDAAKRFMLSAPSIPISVANSFSMGLSPTGKCASRVLLCYLCISGA